MSTTHQKRQNSFETFERPIEYYRMQTVKLHMISKSEMFPVIAIVVTGLKAGHPHEQILSNQVITSQKERLNKGELI